MGQTISEFVYHSFHLDRCLYVVVEPNGFEYPHFSIGTISHAVKNNPKQIVDNVEQQCNIYLHWIAIPYKNIKYSL